MLFYIERCNALSGELMIKRYYKESFDDFDDNLVYNQDSVNLEILKNFAERLANAIEKLLKNAQIKTQIKVDIEEDDPENEIEGYAVVSVGDCKMMLGWLNPAKMYVYVDMYNNDSDFEYIKVYIDDFPSAFKDIWPHIPLLSVVQGNYDITLGAISKSLIG